MDIVRRTDPTTVTQHGLYMRPLADNPLFQYQPPASSEPGKPTPATHPAASQNSETATQPQAQSSESQSDTQQQIFGSSQPANPSQQKASGGKWEDWHQPAVALDSHQTDGGSKHPEAENWGRGRITLLGDAAHATIPNGQGLSLAVEDAVVLAWHLKQQGLCPSALRSYEHEQLKRVKIIHVKGTDAATPEDRERYIFKPTFKPLWQNNSSSQEISRTCIVDFEC
ncbi:TPA: hypothetical protein ACH3X2_004745 [Trebouxia sp. C0005]